MQKVMKQVDVIMLPAGGPAGLLAEGPPESLFTNNGYLTAFNVSGHPAVALCMGYAADGLPFSLQIAVGLSTKQPCFASAIPTSAQRRGASRDRIFRARSYLPAC